jgi:hypothetical protein
MVKYVIRCHIFSVSENYWYVSAVAVQAGAPLQGVISRYHECDSLSAAEVHLEGLREQVLAAVAAEGGEVVDQEHPKANRAAA